MLAYVFWHRPRPDVEPGEYEHRLRAFHARLDATSASYRVSPLPFASVSPVPLASQDAYEDWYLVEGWSELGDLNAAAVSGERQAPHDAVAELMAEGWGGIYMLMRGRARAPHATRWVDKPLNQSYREFSDALPAITVWQRQMVLGPAPEFCLEPDSSTEERLGATARSAVYLESAATSQGSG